MFAYLIRRLVQGVFVIVVVSFITFVIFFIVPKLLGGNLAVLYAGKSPSQATINAVTDKLGLNKPIPVQYLEYMKGLVAGRTFGTVPPVVNCPAPCLGFSFANNTLVRPQLVGDFPVTLSLAIGASVLWLFFGVLAGVIAALRKGRIADRAVMVGALAGISMPVNFTALVVALLVNTQWKLYGDNGLQYVPFTQNPLSWAWNLLFPWLVLAFLTAATYARITRATMLETLSEDYVRTARAKGLRETVVVGKHALRSLLTPIVTLFGLDFGALLGGAVVTEFVFGLHGIGLDAIDAIGRQDIPTVMGVTLFASTFIVVANIVVDMLYAVLDPRVRLG